MILERNESGTLPKIAFEEMSGLISIEGRAVSSEITDHFNHFLPYLKECLTKYPLNINAHIDLEYFNTRATLLLTEFFKYLKEYENNSDKDINVYWHYEYGDDDILEAGEDFEEISKLTFNYIEKKSKD